MSVPLAVLYKTKNIQHIDGLVQDCGNSSALAMELLQSCTKPSLCTPFCIDIILYIINHNNFVYGSISFTPFCCLILYLSHVPIVLQLNHQFLRIVNRYNFVYNKPWQICLWQYFLHSILLLDFISFTCSNCTSIKSPIPKNSQPEDWLIAI